jgi:glutathione S-transferase
MIKLYFLPYACCSSVHIILKEIKVEFELIYVGKNANEQIKSKFAILNSLKSVPVLELEDGTVITQCIAILEYLADQFPQYNLLGKIGSKERIEVIKWLSFVATDLHKSFSPLFQLEQIAVGSEVTQQNVRNWALANINKYFMILNNHLAANSYLAAERFSIADAYLFVVYQWTKYTGVSTQNYPNLSNYIERIARRNSIKSVLHHEAKYL